ncbi:hypothetical protein BO86DRAFT_396765 [Aspergillus japonicus CBS 114.51]|uniref:Uncharacterized protein n=1 Tax=Aspergillus japonicus CBS 114.51 TaxID=1448312 RepID=A0A8T8XAN8_ASPJA|nr:hypothetical protein BO86DRAFT_396765 [Aspergillus japonicus CBS 114.51]RAH85141.1 hypothetical protein BO86DRAFT_396765 [Aspergillus japonicus CBS 114.51]
MSSRHWQVLASTSRPGCYELNMINTTGADHEPLPAHPYQIFALAKSADVHPLQIHTLRNAFAPSAASWHRTGRETAGPALSNWCLAYNQSDDLVWLNTQGYHEGYFVVNSAPGGAHFVWAEFAVKARDHEARYMVLERGVIPSMGGQAACTHADMVELARRWDGYEVTGDEKEYFLGCIRAATQKRDEMAA